MTQAEDGNLEFSPNCMYGTNRQLACSTEPNFADSTRRSAIFAEQVIERQWVVRARAPQIGCSADQVYSHGRHGSRGIYAASLSRLRPPGPKAMT